MKIHISVNTNYVNKVDTTSQTYRENFSNWENIECSLQELLDIVTIDGWAINSQLLQSSLGHRARDVDFKQTNLVALDIDNGMPLEEALNNPLFLAYGAAIYTSQSFTPKLHKYRLLFVTEQMLTTGDELRLLRVALNAVFNGDPVTTNPCRVFFGNNTESSASALYNNILTTEAQEAIIAHLVNSLPPAKEKVEHTFSDKEITGPEMLYIAKNLKNNLSGYSDHFKAICALKSNNFSYSQVANIIGSTFTSTNGRTTYSVEREWKVISNRNSGRMATMGTIWHLLGGYPKFDRLDTMKIKIQRGLK